MNRRIEFETPENISVAYQPAGVGTRFVAWIVDQVLVTLLSIALLVGFIAAAAAIGSTLAEYFSPVPGASPNDAMMQVQLLILGVWWLVWSLGSLVYFGLSELFLGGQTFGKRRLHIRVVKLDGFALDHMSILVRTLFRIVDHIPLLWIVPVMSARGQRLGDMAAGSIVVSDEDTPLADVREALAGRTAADARFRFDSTMLKRVRPQDFHAVEQLVDRWTTTPPNIRDPVAAKIIDALVIRLGCDAPPPAEHHRFLEDLLAAEFRRQNRSLG